MAWLLLGLATALMYGLASAGRTPAMSLRRLLPFQALPAVGAALARFDPEAYLK